MKQMLLTRAIRRKLEANYAAAQSDKTDLRPVVKFFHAYGAATWLIQDIDPDGRMYGLCDLGMGYPELGYVDLQEMEDLRATINGRKFAFQAIERDTSWTPEKSTLEYAQDARDAGRMTADAAPTTNKHRSSKQPG